MHLLLLYKIALLLLCIIWYELVNVFYVGIEPFRLHLDSDEFVL